MYGAEMRPSTMTAGPSLSPVRDYGSQKHETAPAHLSSAGPSSGVQHLPLLRHSLAASGMFV